MVDNVRLARDEIAGWGKDVVLFRVGSRYTVEAGELVCQCNLTILYRPRRIYGTTGNVTRTSAVLVGIVPATSRTPFSAVY